MRDTNEEAAAGSAAAQPGEDELSEAAAQPGEDEEIELERLRAENAELRRKAGMVRRRRSWRTPVAIVLIILGCILAPVSVLGVWAGNEVSNTGRYVATVEPLVHNPAMQNYLTDQITNQITSHVNIAGIINQGAVQLNSRGLPKIASLLNQFGPQIASSVTGFIHSTVHSVVSSQAFATAWVQVNTVAHQALVKVLSGQGGGAISTSNGQIVLNLGPLIAVAKQDLVAHGFKLASSIPPVTPTLALFQAKDLEKAQSQYRLIKALKIVLPILALVLIGAGVYVARGRRHALVGAGLGLAASMLVLAVGLEIFRSVYLSSVPSSTLPSDAAAAVWDAFVHFIKVGLRVVLVVGLVVAIGAFFTGPSHTAVQTRSALTSGIDWIRHYGERRGVSTGPVGQWTYLHRRSLRVGAVALFGLIFAFWAQPTALVVILIVVVLLVVLGLIELIGRRRHNRTRLVKRCRDAVGSNRAPEYPQVKAEVGTHPGQPTREASENSTGASVTSASTLIRSWLGVNAAEPAARESARLKCRREDHSPADGGVAPPRSRHQPCLLTACSTLLSPTMSRGACPASMISPSSLTSARDMPRHRWPLTPPTAAPTAAEAMIAGGTRCRRRRRRPRRPTPRAGWPSHPCSRAPCPRRPW